MQKDAWNPEQYTRFQNERSQPFFDLLALVEPRPSMRVVDLGCGTGELTRLLHDQLKAGSTLGIDSSASMLAKSEALAGNGLRFAQGNISDFTADHSFDLIFSNAALHWLPDHEALLRQLTAALAAGGQLAVQVPANDDHPTHVIAAQVADESPFREAMRGYRREWPVLKPEAYAVMLNRLGYKRQQVRLQVYGHTLGSRDDVIEWVKGTLLTDYEKRLATDLYADFLRLFRARLLGVLEDTRPYFYPFKRILMWAEL
jgi:trans-aconitate 2-methyltransferase